MKNKALLIGAVILIVGIVVVLGVSRDRIPDSTDTQTLSGQYCFRAELNQDVTEVVLSIEGTTVTGTMNWIPFEKDSARGTLAGVVTDTGELDLMYTYVIEGAHQTETKLMKITDGKLYIKHGELVDPEYNGNLRYKDVNTAVYTEVIEPCS